MAGQAQPRPASPARLARPGRPGRPSRPPVPDSSKMIPPNRPGTYLIRRALKNDSDPCNECSKRCHERQVMKFFVQRVILSCFANNLRLLRKCTMAPWYHGTMVPWYRGTMVPWYHGTMVPYYHGTVVPWYIFEARSNYLRSNSESLFERKPS